MAIPDFQSMMLPLLKLIGDGAEKTNRFIEDAIAAQFQVTEIEREELLPSGQQKRFSNRVAWAKAHLKKAGLIESPTRKTVRISEAGKGVLAKAPTKVDLRFLKQFESYDWHKQDVSSSSESSSEVEQAGSTPEELLDASYQSIRNDLADDLLEKLKVSSPSFFERLVVQLLVAMGYGGSLADAGQVVGKSGDGGIDGIIKEDKLGLDVLCIQAKRWPENTVGRPMVQAFAGSMEGYRAKKGVLITTSAFSRDAHEYVNRIERKIVLIDGNRLAELMIDYDIGVTTARTYVIKKVDSDYFAEEQGS